MNFTFAQNVKKSTKLFQQSNLIKKPLNLNTIKYLKQGKISIIYK